MSLRLFAVEDVDGQQQIGLVYLMTDGYLLKFGYTSRKIGQRSGELRARVVAFTPGTRADERRHHAQFKSWNVGGEWFRLPDNSLMLGFLRRMVAEWAGEPGLRAFDDVVAANLRRAA